jgi:Hydrazine synthase alpha subunit middle domain
VLLDAAGRTLRQERGWFWMRSGEQRICVGCHTGPERAPDNRVPEVLHHSTTPVDLSGAATKIAAGGH